MKLLYCHPFPLSWWWRWRLWWWYIVAVHKYTHCTISSMQWVPDHDITIGGHDWPTEQPTGQVSSRRVAPSVHPSSCPSIHSNTIKAPGSSRVDRSINIAAFIVHSEQRFDDGSDDCFIYSMVTRMVTPPPGIPISRRLQNGAIQQQLEVDPSFSSREKLKSVLSQCCSFYRHAEILVYRYVMYQSTSSLHHHILFAHFTPHSLARRIILCKYSRWKIRFRGDVPRSVHPNALCSG